METYRMHFVYHPIQRWKTIFRNDEIMIKALKTVWKIIFISFLIISTTNEEKGS